MQLVYIARPSSWKVHSRAFLSYDNARRWLETVREDRPVTPWIWTYEIDLSEFANNGWQQIG